MVPGDRGRVTLLREGTDQLELGAETQAATVLVVRDGWAPGWTARVNGRPEPVWRTDGRHRAVALPAGRSDVVLSYRPPGLTAGVALSGVGLTLVVGLGWRRRPAGPRGRSS